MEKYDFTVRHTKSKLIGFAEYIKGVSQQIGFKISARGWCYQLEQAGYIDKSQFNKVEKLINKCRKKGLLPIDFTAEEEGRKFSAVHQKTYGSYKSYVSDKLESALLCADWYDPDWWAGETYYIQMLVEKIDLKTLFLPECQKYHIPIATSKGWSSMLQRGEYARRFEKAEAQGLKCVLLYCGDHDPDGLRISDFIRSNLEDLKDVVWGNGQAGYDPQGLIIDRFGLDYKFIQKHGFTWIDNLITGSGKNLASPQHRNYKLAYLQNYLKSIGERKCEANAIVPKPNIARGLVIEAIEKYLGGDALERFSAAKEEARAAVNAYKARHFLDEKLADIIKNLD